MWVFFDPPIPAKMARQLGFKSIPIDTPLETGEQAIEDLLSLASESEQPRAYEVLGQLLKITGENAEKLSSLHEKRKKYKEESTGKGVRGQQQVNIEGNALFVGSTDDLQKYLDEAPEDYVPKMI